MPTASRKGKKTLLGFAIDNSDLAVAKRENPAGPGYADPEDVSLLENLRILYKARGIYKKHPLMDSNPEEIRQFFRWSLSDERHPLPPLARRILCLKRAYLTEGIDSMRTVPGHRTTERILLAEIDKLLHDDGVKNVVNGCMADIQTGFWSTPKLPTPPATAPVTAACPPVLCSPEDLEKLKALQGEVEALKTAVSAATATATASSVAATNMEHLRMANQTLQEQLEALKAQSTEAIAAKNAEYKNEVDQIMKLMTAISEERTQFEDQFLDAQDALVAAQAALAQSQGQSVEKQRALQADLAAAQKAKTDLENQHTAELTALRQELEGQLADQTQTSEAALQEAKAQQEASQQRLVNLEKALRAAEEKGRNVETLRLALDVEQSAVQKANKQVSELTDQLVQMAQLQQDLDDKTKDLQQTLEASAQELMALRSSSDAAQTAVQALQEQLDALQAQKTSSNAEKVEKNRRIAELEKQIQTSQESQQAAMTSLQQELAALQAQKTSSNAEKAAKNAEIRALQEHLKQRNMAVRFSAEELTKASQNAKTSSAKRNEKIRALQDQLTTKASSNSAKNAEIRALQEQLKDVQASLQMRIDELEAQGKEKNTKIATFFPDYERKLEESRALAEQVRKLETDLDAARQFRTRSAVPTAVVPQTLDSVAPPAGVGALNQDENVQALANAAKAVRTSNITAGQLRGLDNKIRQYRFTKNLLSDAFKVIAANPEGAEAMVMGALEKAQKFANYLPPDLRSETDYGEVRAVLTRLANEGQKIGMRGGLRSKRRKTRHRKNARSSRKTRRHHHK